MPGKHDTEIIELASKGLSFREIGVILSRSYQSVRETALRLGLHKSKPRKVSPKKIERGRTLRAMGLRWHEIAARLDVSETTLYKHIGAEPDERAERVVLLWNEGKRADEIALKLRLSKNTVRFYLRRNGLISKGMTPEMAEMGLELRRNGMSWAEIADRLGVKKHVAYTALRRKCEE